jgi:hypothetical protein
MYIYIEDRIEQRLCSKSLCSIHIFVESRNILSFQLSDRKLIWKKKLAFLNCANLLIFCTKQNIYRTRTSYIFIFGRSLFYLYIWFIFSFEMISELDFFLFQFSLIRNANCLPLIMRCVYISWFLQFF